MIKVSNNWRTSHPGGAAAILTMGIDRQQKNTAALDRKKETLEKELREKYQGIPRAEMRAMPVMDAYTQYYKRYKKTYHLLLQLDSICNKGKSIPHVDPLVQAMFMAELDTLLLTAGHDLDRISGQINLDSAAGDETYSLINGETATCKPGDMVTTDAQGVFCSIIYGQDQRTQITPQTEHVIYVVYVPPGVERLQIENHLQELETNVRLAFPGARNTSREIISANPITNSD